MSHHVPGAWRKTEGRSGLVVSLISFPRSIFPHPRQPPVSERLGPDSGVETHVGDSKIRCGGDADSLEQQLCAGSCTPVL